ncbi:hypothetical protein E4U21_004264 [Claviceps maximensis]|nr:hypothetical protein E4U21_004264 [Claviceps maximensis]
MQPMLRNNLIQRRHALASTKVEQTSPVNAAANPLRPSHVRALVSAGVPDQSVVRIREPTFTLSMSMS